LRWSVVVRGEHVGDGDGEGLLARGSGAGGGATGCTNRRPTIYT
jgi:hypothetical protein